jgi:hypothetical protein
MSSAISETTLRNAEFTSALILFTAEMNRREMKDRRGVG